MRTNAVIHELAEVTLRDEWLITGLVFTATIFALLPSGLSWTDQNDISTLMTGSLGFQLQWGGIFVISAIVVARHRALALANLRVMNPFILATLAYSAASTIWSPVDYVTIKKVVQFAGFITFGLAVQSDRKPWTHSIQVMATAITAIELASAVVAIVNPSFGIDEYLGYAWRGIVSGKNQLGEIGATGTLLWVALWRVNAVSRSMFWFGFGLSLLCVVMSKSSTGATIAALGLFIFWLLYKQHIGSPLWLQRIIVIVGMFLLVIGHLFFVVEGHLPAISEIVEPFANIFDKGADLTGRVDIWEPLILEIRKHWIFGIGYGAFWLGPGSASQAVLDHLYWTPTQGHNGYLDLLNELGAIGILLLVGLLISHIRSLGRLKLIDRQAAVLFTSILITILFSNITESTIFRGIAYPFLMLIFSCVSVTSVLNQQQLR